MTTDEKKRKYCPGCRDDFYNGKNPHGVKQCWHLESSRLVRRKFVHIDRVPPWSQEPEWTLDCHHRDRYIAMKPEAMR